MLVENTVFWMYCVYAAGAEVACQDAAPKTPKVKAEVCL
jgi:hypothetical protein